MSFGTNSIDNGPPATLSVGASNAPSALMGLFKADIQPGADIDYQTCKTIYSYHPLGAKMAESPIKLAQSQLREIQIPGGPEKDLKEAFLRKWKEVGGCGADLIIRNTMTLARVYGISSVALGIDGEDAVTPFNIDNIHKKKIFFNALDPLNTAGSLVLNQDPNSPDFLKPSQQIRVAGKPYHHSRCVVVMNEQPIYIQFTSSGFGFVGRSVFQRAFYPLKTYVLSMIADHAVIEKSALLVAKLKSPGSMMDKAALAFNSLKRTFIKGAITGNVVSIGVDESIESINMTNLKDPAEFARNNLLKNIATAADMPASLINQETLAEGFGEGSEDAKNIARYIDGVRIDMAPLYHFFDNIVMHLAWTPEFYISLQRKYPELEKVPYETAFTDWKNAFFYEWPNLLQEPDSKKIEVDDKILKAAIGVFEVLAPVLDPENKATAADWLANVINERRELFSSHLEIDLDALKDYIPPVQEKEPENPAESGRD